ncbi:hypothetical protein J2129_001376 [Methanofollis sp. W23]|uniref:hypothetical protein n=1 Tax=Methanofollis sp. W23 TaxID=2817849 RepID=UPI001AE126A7|nr:hypothetical protein [Methanofollis sp. W23]MBP2145922.1 hypothetical protein [Methanofollis sp. W23]
MLYYIFSLSPLSPYQEELEDQLRKFKFTGSDSGYGDIMQPRKTILILIVAAALLVSAATAHDLRTETADQITVSPIPDGVIDLEGFDNAVRSIGDTIYPNSLDSINKDIPSNVKTIKVYLDWSGHGDGPHSVRLNILLPAPNGQVGPYYDSDDGLIDEKICFSFSESPSLPSGTWTFCVFGDDVPEEGVSYTLDIGY